jgi:ubiquinone/menaquinone biosynthesis C-methylase UbiE
MKSTGKFLVSVFGDCKAHKTTAEIIKAHSSNKTDIRKLAIGDIDLSGIKKVIDLGCGFGYFTEELLNAVSPDAVFYGIDCHEIYRKEYLRLCDQANHQAYYFTEGIQALAGFETNRPDLILSSYSMYFFREALPIIARINGNNGKLIIITHGDKHLQELADSIIDFIFRFRSEKITSLPFNDLLENFSGLHSYHLLKTYFENVKMTEYCNQLVFSGKNIKDLINYVSLKKPFFMPFNYLNDPEFLKEFQDYLSNSLGHDKELKINKNDLIFYCTNYKQV